MNLCRLSLVAFKNESLSCCFVISCFCSKSSLSRIVGNLGRVKTISSSGTKFYFSFSFSITLSTSPIRLSPDNVCVVFVATSFSL